MGHGRAVSSGGSVLVEATSGPQRHVDQADEHGHLDEGSDDAGEGLARGHAEHADGYGDAELEVVARSGEGDRGVEVVGQPHAQAQPEGGGPHDREVRQQRDGDAGHVEGRGGDVFASFQHSFCVACDMPFIKKSLVQYLIEKIDDADVVIPRTKDGLEPLHAIYSKNCVKPIRRMIDEGKSKIVDIYDQVKVKIVDEKDFFRYDPGGESFINVNTPEELRSIRKNEESHLK